LRLLCGGRLRLPQDLDPADLDHDTENCSKRSAPQDAFYNETTYFAETSDAGVGPDGENGNPENVITDDGSIDVGEGLGDNFWGGFESGRDDGIAECGVCCGVGER
jgi:hypothetical protein